MAGTLTLHSKLVRNEDKYIFNLISCQAAKGLAKVHYFLAKHPQI